MLANRDRKAGLYVTELGWGSQNDPGKVAFEVGWRGQAEALRSAYGYLIAQRRRLALRAVYWFSWRDAPPGVPTCNFCDSSGLFTADFAPKPAWGALVKLTRSPIGSSRGHR